MHITVNRNDSTTMTKQIYNQLKEYILDGTLKSEEKLPSTRKLSESLKISKNIIINVYEMLAAEGYIVTRPGSGVYVSRSVSLKRGPAGAPELSFRSEYSIYDGNGINFRIGLPALDHFPRSKWLQCCREVLNEIPSKDLGYGSSNGYLPFRKTLAAYLRKERGIQCREDQIIVTSGSIQGLHLMLLYFSQTNAAIAIEDPTTSGLKDLLDTSKIDFIAVPVDQDGFSPSLLPENRDISCIITTPSHQYPLGGSMPIQRRIDLIRYARNHNCYIIEDDYDSEIRYSNQPVESLYELDPARVIYMGSFSKILLPSLRLGYAVLPYALVEKIYRLKWSIDIHTPTLLQATMNKFITHGYLYQHLSKTIKLYRKRRQALIDALKNNFGDSIKIYGKEAGIHLVVEFEHVVFSEDLLVKIINAGIYVMCVGIHSLTPDKHSNQLMLGYGNLTESQIEKAISILHDVIEHHILSPLDKEQP